MRKVSQAIIFALLFTAAVAVVGKVAKFSARLSYKVWYEDQVRETVRQELAADGAVVK